MNKLSRTTTTFNTDMPIRFLQFGGGHFLRGFTDWLIDRLNEETDFAGGIAVVKPTPQGDYTTLREQDGLYHVSLNGYWRKQLKQEKRLITCIRDIIHPYQEWEKFLRTATNPDIRFILSNTTEIGIAHTPEDQLVDNPPREFPAKLTRWLYARYQHFGHDVSKTCIVLPHELIVKNGDTLKTCVQAYARQWQLGDPFMAWLDENTFCNTLVDRIIFGYPHAEAEEIQQSLGYRDQLLVAGEYYHNWVIEGPSFVADELPFGQTSMNVKFVEDSDQYRRIKVRILNGAHTSIVPLGYLQGCRTVKEVMDNDILSEFIRQEVYDEIIPTLDLEHSVLTHFAEETFERFRNPFLHHKLLTISLYSTYKFTMRLLPSLKNYHRQYGRLPIKICIALAALLRFYKGEWEGEEIPLNDEKEKIDRIKMAWSAFDGTWQNLVQALISDRFVWGEDLTTIPDLSSTIAALMPALDNAEALDGLLTTHV